MFPSIESLVNRPGAHFETLVLVRVRSLGKRKPVAIAALICLGTHEAGNWSVIYLSTETSVSNSFEERRSVLVRGNLIVLVTDDKEITVTQ